MLLRDRAHQALSLAHFETRNLPELVGESILDCPYERQYILRMCIKSLNSDFKIPDCLNWLNTAIDQAVEYQRDNVQVEHPYCYVTVRHGKVESTTDDEWHVDGFSTRITHLPEQNYVVCSDYPTQCLSLPICFPTDFDPNKHNVHTYIQSMAEYGHQSGIGRHAMHCFDPYVIHRRPYVPPNVTRTFVRISFVPIEIQDINNTPNPLLFMPSTNRDGVAIRNSLLDYTH